MTDSTAAVAPLTGRTAWARNLEAPLRSFLRTETGGAAILLAATLAALVWANVDSSSYTACGTRSCSIHIGGSGISLTLRQWVNSGLMTFFFLVVALEARREFDLGELRDRRRLALPVVAGARRDADPGRDLPRIQRGQELSPRLGNRDVDRHGVRARDARAGRPPLSRRACARSS